MQKETKYDIYRFFFDKLELMLWNSYLYLLYIITPEKVALYTFEYVNLEN